MRRSQETLFNAAPVNLFLPARLLKSSQREMGGGVATTEEYDAFFRAEYSSVVRTAQMILQHRQAAEDVAQEAFTRLYRHWSKVSKYEKPEAWVRRIAIRIAAREVRKQRARSAFKSDAETQYLDVVSDIDLMQSVARLPAMQRAAVVLFYLEDRPIRELAEILDCSETTAGVHLHRARKKLATLLYGSVDEEEVTEGVV